MAEFLVEIGIDSVSLNPDTVLKTTRHVLEVEKRLGRPRRAAHDETDGAPADVLRPSAPSR
jgi:pyruvate,water dikinase